MGDETMRMVAAATEVWDAAIEALALALGTEDYEAIVESPLVRDLDYLMSEMDTDEETRAALAVLRLWRATFGEGLRARGFNDVLKAMADNMKVDWLKVLAYGFDPRLANAILEVLDVRPAE